jgi:hypothetical protein
MIEQSASWLLASAEGRAGELREALRAASPLLLVAIAASALFFAFAPARMRAAYGRAVLMCAGAVFVGIAITFWLL